VGHCVIQSLYVVPGVPNLSLGGPDRNAKIDALEAAMRERGSQGMAWEIVHHFAPGIYAREMRVPAGAIITSRVHKFENLSILSKGRMALYMEDGTVREVSAGFHIVAPPGARRVAAVLEDAVWTCVHNTDERDLSRIEAHFTAATPAEYQLFLQQQHPEGAMPTIENQQVQP
jgi:quercetin dioxygenase-like cupin family protein